VKTRQNNQITLQNMSHSSIFRHKRRLGKDFYMDAETTTQKAGADFTATLDNVDGCSTENVSGNLAYVRSSLGSDEDKDSETIPDTNEDIAAEDDHSAAAEQNEEDEIDKEVADAAKNSEVKANYPRQ
jgi:hypothetical protein